MGVRLKANQVFIARDGTALLAAMLTFPKEEAGQRHAAYMATSGR